MMMKTLSSTSIVVPVAVASIVFAYGLPASATEFTARFPVGDEESAKSPAQSYINGFSKPFTATPRDHTSDLSEPLTDSGKPFISSFSTQKHMLARTGSASSADEHIERPYSIMSR